MIPCKKLSHLLPSRLPYSEALVSPSSHGRRHHLLADILLFSTSATDHQSSPPKIPFIVDYLIGSCGFSPEMAAKASRYLSHLKSPSKPDKVMHFLKQSGLSDAHTSTLIFKDPGLLCANVETTLKPKLQALQHLGFSDHDLHRLIVLCPSVLSCRDLLSKIEFWRVFYGGNSDHFFKIIRRDPYLLTTRFDTRIEPCLSLLRSYGLSDAQIAKMILRNPRLITKKVDLIEALVNRAEELGVPRGSGMFCYALCVVNSLSEANINSKVRLLQGMGCLEADIKSTVQSYPSLLLISEKKMRDCMEFLTKKAGCEPSYVICHPVLLTCSLERKLIPRNHVLQILWSKELAGNGSGLYNAMIITENKFLEKYVLPYKEMVPGLHETYIAACAGKVAMDSKH